jgi:hypothetical protein
MSVEILCVEVLCGCESDGSIAAGGHGVMVPRLFGMGRTRSWCEGIR